MRVAKTLSLSLSTRSVDSPGSYSVNSSGILDFPTVEDFHQTASYIFTDSTDVHLQFFRNSFSILTLNKRADQIIDSVETTPYYLSEVLLNWPVYNKYVDLSSFSEDSILTKKYGAWGEFLNQENLVIIDGGLYRISENRSIYIVDGDIEKLDDAIELEESDTMNGIYINWRACTCDPTGFEWKYKSVVYSGSKHRIRSEQTFSNLTISKELANGKREIKPMFAHRSEIHIQKKGIVWFCHRMIFDWDRQVHVSHNLQLPIGPNTPSTNLWYESTGWNDSEECRFNWNTSYEYPKYVIDPTGDMPAGYCLSVKIFSQNVTTHPTPVMHNGWYFYPYPYFDMSGYYSDPLNNCWNFDWLYML